MYEHDTLSHHICLQPNTLTLKFIRFIIILFSSLIQFFYVSSLVCFSSIKKGILNNHHKM